jgi:hypothetical protein
VSDEEGPYPVQVRRHVWESLVSMLRVYAHAASLNGKEYVVTILPPVTSLPNEASVKCQDRELRLHFSPENGEGSWIIVKPGQEECGGFRIEEDGTLTFPAGPKPLDTAAIEWIEHLVHATSTESNGPLRQPLGIS